MSYSDYDIPKDKYKKMFAEYLQNDGTQLMNTVRLEYDLFNNYKNEIVNFWKLFDIDYLENEYIKWKNGSWDGTSFKDDQEWIYTKFVEKLCASYQITREYFSYWATETIDPNTSLPYETTSVLLNNLNMLRLLKVRRSSIGFDGTRESLERILRTSLSNKYLGEAEDQISFILQTDTGTGIITYPRVNAILNVYIIRPTVAANNILWTKYDEYLVNDSQYFVQLLGIITNIEVIDQDTLLYDSGIFDADKYK